MTIYIYWLYTTVEVPLSLSNSLIIRPSLFYNSEYKFLYVGRLGSDIGFRHHPNKKTEGFYLQGQAGIFYMFDLDHYPNGKKQNFMYCDIIGYIGYSAKSYSGVRMFIDFGIGIATEKMSMIPFAPESYLIRDFNLGIGIPLGKNKK